MLFHFSKKQAYLSLGRSLTMLMAGAIGAVWVSSCSTPLDVNAPVKIKPQLAEKQYTSFDGDPLGYHKWVPSKGEPSMVVIGVHGISGHAGDYKNLGEYFLKHNPKTALYAAETRGQGMDANTQRRGDIYRAKDWYRDLYTFTGLVRKVHPKAKIVWFGESMGSLIAMHAYNVPPQGGKAIGQKPDAIVVASPIVDVSDQLKPWKYQMARGVALLLPTLRISLETLSDGQRAMVTKDDIHEEQAAKNPWYIRRYTLRLLLVLGDMAADLNENGAQIDCPVLVLHGGEDIFTPEEKVKALYASIPKNAANARKFYPSSYHLLMYDHEREKIFKDISQWLNKLND